ncbi:hypothetical protein [Desulfovirgula thermocuniculi]|uniref:hypothetical protein n=1 Tax=Desulfovirgula thermocuniculi TaxID=348842 RepID=UPI00041F6C44|nr:hypothetical protein [Desulfovirgula thermocuniculi]
MSVAQNIKLIAQAGIKATPIPGTAKYHIQFQDGSSVFIGEHAFFALLNSNLGAEGIIKALQELKTTPAKPFPGHAAKYVTG